MRRGRPTERCQRCWKPAQLSLLTCRSPYTVEQLCEDCARQARVIPGYRGKTYQRDTRNVPPMLREAVFDRDRGRCRYCNGPGETLDHVEPWATGGRSNLQNLVCACRDCNAQKGSLTLEAAGLTLLPEPEW